MAQAAAHLSPNQKALKRLLKNKAAVLGLIIIFFATFIALFGYWIVPDNTPNANNQIVQLATQKQGFAVKIIKKSKNKEVARHHWLSVLLWGQPATHESVPINDFEIIGDKIILNKYTGSSSIGSQIDTVLLAQMLYALDEKSYKFANEQASFTLLNGQTKSLLLGQLQSQVVQQITQKTYWLGTDKFGRDNLSRLILGVRVSLSIGLMAVLISLFIGVILGALAGYYRGWVDDIIMWIVNVFWSIPLLLWVFALILALGREFWQIYLAVGLTMWVEVARVVRGQFFSLREKEYVEAAHSLGLSDMRIIFKHILPNTVGPLTVITAANFASAIITEAGLSFLGIGVQPPQASWGTMLHEYYSYIGTNKAFLALIPGMAILLLTLAFNLVGNGIRDALDVRN